MTEEEDLLQELKPLATLLGIIVIFSNNKLTNSVSVFGYLLLSHFKTALNLFLFSLKLSVSFYNLY